MPTSHPRLSHLHAALSVATLVLVGCADLSPVKSFADETKKMAAAFDPLTRGTVDACEARMVLRKTITTEKDFDAEQVRAQAKAMCQPLTDGAKYIVEIESVLASYADTLAALADEKLPSYKAEFSGLKSAVDGVQIDGKSILPKDKVAAVTDLAAFIARLVTQRAAAREAKALLDQQEGFDAAVDALTAYVRLIHKPYLEERLTLVSKQLPKELTATSASEPLAARVQKMALQEDAARTRQALAAAGKFESAAGKLKAARAETRARLDDKNLDPKQLLALAEEVRGLRKQLVSAF